MRKMYYGSIALYISAAIIILYSGGNTVIGEVIVFGKSVQVNWTWAELLGKLLWVFVPEIIVLAVQCICGEQKKSYGTLVKALLQVLHETLSPQLMFALGGMLLIGIPGMIGGNSWGKGLLFLMAVHMVMYAVYNVVSWIRRELRELRELRLLIQEEEYLYK